MRRVLLILTLLIVPGPQPLGLRVVEQYDLSRGYRTATNPHTGKATTGERSRPIQTLIWYPAEKGTAIVVNTGDYLRLGGKSDEFPAALAERARLEAGYIDGRVSTLPPDRAGAC